MILDSSDAVTCDFRTPRRIFLCVTHNFFMRASKALLATLKQLRFRVATMMIFTPATSVDQEAAFYFDIRKLLKSYQNYKYITVRSMLVK